jgi:hypothetical protein
MGAHGSICKAMYQRYTNRMFRNAMRRKKHVASRAEQEAKGLSKPKLSLAIRGGIRTQKMLYTRTEVVIYRRNRTTGRGHEIKCLAIELRLKRDRFPAISTQQLVERFRSRLPC